MKFSRAYLLVALMIGVWGERASVASNKMQIEQVIGGINGDITAQAIQLRMRDVSQGTVSQNKLIVRDAAGANPITVLDFPANVDKVGIGVKILIASASFSNYTVPSAAPDFTMTSLIPASYLAAGTLTFEKDSDGTVYWRLSWGGESFTGSGLGSTINDSDGDFNPAFSGPLPSNSLQALQFTGAATDLSTNNAAQYALTPGAAAFTSNAPASFTVVECVQNAQCDDGNACTDNTCNMGTNLCEFPSNGPAGQCCNPNDGMLTPIDDANTCTNDGCDVGTGIVTHDGAPLNGMACGSATNNDCTNPDTCLNGVCQPYHEPDGTSCPPQTCSSSVLNPCNFASECITGVCTHHLLQDEPCSNDADCAMFSGEPWATCGQNNPGFCDCTIGGCCVGSTCMQCRSPGQCTAIDGLYIGDNSICTFSCSSGACCTAGGDHMVGSNNSCTTSAQCIFPEVCTFGQCRIRSTECLADPQNTFVGGVPFANAGRCDAGPLESSFCQSNEDCGRCEVGNMNCDSDGDCPPPTCQQGVCDGGVCISGPFAFSPHVCVTNIDCGLCLSTAQLFCDSNGDCPAILCETGICDLTTPVFTCPPDNDKCAFAFALANGVTAFSNTDARTDGPSDPCSTPPATATDTYDDIWHDYVGCGGTATISLCGVAAAFDSVLSVYSDTTCPMDPMTRVACSDDNCGLPPTMGGSSSVTFMAVMGAAYKVRIGSTSPGQEGGGEIMASCVVQCGDGLVGGSEACDDSNAMNGDGCDNNCTLTACGNGIVTGNEECDDGNTMNGDGCDSMCVIETGFACATVVDCRNDTVDNNACNHASCAGMCAYACVKFGDVKSPTDGNVNLDDILCGLGGFAGFFNCPNADINPCAGNGIINLDDLLSILAAFAGANPCTCNAMGTAPSCQ